MQHCTSNPCLFHPCSVQQVFWTGVTSDAVIAWSLMPNNYGTAARAKIRVQNTSIRDIEVAILFFYNEWGVPNNCKYLGM